MKRVTASVPDDVEALARELADREGQSVSSFFAEAVEQYAREKRRRQAARRVREIIERTTVQPGAVDELHRQRKETDPPFRRIDENTPLRPRHRLLLRAL